MQESENNSLSLAPESPVPSQEPSASSEAGPMAAEAGAQPIFPPNVPLRELQATYEMLVGFKQAIIENQYWPGDKLQHVAMGLSMIARLESQYRAQVEQARAREKEQGKAARAAIHAAGGAVRGE